jgi:hypothetical protein
MNLQPLYRKEHPGHFQILLEETTTINDKMDKRTTRIVAVGTIGFSLMTSMCIPSTKIPNPVIKYSPEFIALEEIRHTVRDHIDQQTQKELNILRKDAICSNDPELLLNAAILKNLRDEEKSNMGEAIDSIEAKTPKTSDSASIPPEDLRTLNTALKKYYYFLHSQADAIANVVIEQSECTKAQSALLL